MTQQAGKATEISLGEDCGNVVLKANGARIEVSADGNILAFTDGSVSAYKNGHITVRPVVSDDICAVMPDGTVFAGVSPETNQPIYAMPADTSLTMTFNDAIAYAQWANVQKICGHDDWRVPTKNELNVLFNNRAAIGGFNVGGSVPAGWYWSSSSNNEWNAWGQSFSDGCVGYGSKDGHSSVRCVR